MAKFKVNQSVYIKHQGATPWRIVQIDNPERGDDALYHLRDSRNTYEREFGRNLIGTDEPNASARAYNDVVSLEELLRKNGISQQEFQRMMREMQSKGARAVHFIRGKDGRLVFKADGTTIKNEKVRIGDTQFGGATTASLDFAKDRRGDYILAGDEVIADAGDGIDTYEVLKVLPGNKVKIGGLGVEVATVDAKTVSVTRKHGILKRDGDTVVLKNAKFKVGDKVRAVKPRGFLHNDEISKYLNRDLIVVSTLPWGGYIVETKDNLGMPAIQIREAGLTSANSSNPVVANAIAAKARNAADDPQWIKDAQDAIYAIRSGGFPRHAIEKFYSRYGRYTMDGLHRTGEVQKIAEQLNDLKFDVEKSEDTKDKAVKLLYAVQRIKA